MNAGYEKSVAIAPFYRLKDILSTYFVDAYFVDAVDYWPAGLICGQRVTISQRGGLGGFASIRAHSPFIHYAFLPRRERIGISVGVPVVRLVQALRSFIKAVPIREYGGFRYTR